MAPALTYLLGLINQISIVIVKTYKKKRSRRKRTSEKLYADYLNDVSKLPEVHVSRTPSLLSYRSFDLL
jgi:hypothetical protein